jgi:hypothetical protein
MGNQIKSVTKVIEMVFFCILAFVVFQFSKSFNKIEIMKMEMVVTNGEGANGNAKIHCQSGHGNERMLDLKYFIESFSNGNNFCQCA